MAASSLPSSCSNLAWFASFLGFYQCCFGLEITDLLSLEITDLLSFSYSY